MPPFRRPGLAEDDDGAEARPEAASQRRKTFPYAQPPTRTNRVPVHHAMCDEESVVSGLSATSDLDSLYLESSAQKMQYHNPRDQYLLCQRLPGQFGDTSDPALLKEHGSSTLMSGFIDENDNDDNWEDVVFAATRVPASERTPRKSTSDLQRSTIDPVEQERENIQNIILEAERLKKFTPKKVEREKRPSTKNKTTKKEASSDTRRSSTKTKSKKKVANDEAKDKRKSGNNGEKKDKRKSVNNAETKMDKSKVDPPGESKQTKPKSFRFSLKGLKSPMRSKSPMRLKSARE